MTTTAVWPMALAADVPPVVVPTDLLLFTNGILDAPIFDCADVDDAVKWVRKNHPDLASDSLQWWGDLITAPLLEYFRAWQMKQLLCAWDKKGISRLHCIGHSFGSKIITRCIKRPDCPRIESIHLFAACCSADFNENGLNHALLKQDVGDVWYYMSKGDEALKLASLTDWQQNPLGLNGAKAVDPAVALRVHKIENDKMGHTSWFDKANFEWTMNLIVQNATAITT